MFLSLGFKDKEVKQYEPNKKYFFIKKFSCSIAAMEIKTENWANGINCVYAVVFDTGYYYIGSTKSFCSRARNHRLTINQYPKKFGIGVFHNPSVCEIFMLIACHDYDTIVGIERDFLIQNSNDPFMLNKSKSIFKLKTVKEKLCKRMNNLRK